MNPAPHFIKNQFKEYALEVIEKLGIADFHAENTAVSHFQNPSDFKCS